MNKKFFVTGVIAGLLALLSTGCANIKASKLSSQVSVPMEPVYVRPTIVAGKKTISGKATVHSLFGIITWGVNAQAVGVSYDAGPGGFVNPIASLAEKSESVARNAAAYEATTSCKADIILAPQYVIVTKDYFIYKSITCKVKGFPGFVKGVNVIAKSPINSKVTPKGTSKVTSKSKPKVSSKPKVKK